MWKRHQLFANLDHSFISSIEAFTIQPAKQSHPKIGIILTSHHEFFILSKPKRSEKYCLSKITKLCNSRIKDIQFTSVYAIILTFDGKVFSLTENGKVDFLLEDIDQISCGYGHIMALSKFGNVYSWGRGDGGRLGIGSTKDCPSPKMINHLDDVTQICCGFYHSMALTKKGNVYIWGKNNSCILGTGVGQRLVPTLIPNLENVTKIAAGEDVSMALTKNGNVYIWGHNKCGQLGNSELYIRLPTIVVSVQFNPIVDIDLHYSRNCTLILNKENIVMGWGLIGNQKKKIPIKTNYTDIDEAIFSIFGTTRKLYFVFPKPNTIGLFKILQKKSFVEVLFQFPM